MSDLFEHDIDVMRKIDGTEADEDAYRPAVGHRVVSSVGLWYEFNGEKYVRVSNGGWEVP